jgi:fumigallin biosynthesis monooxygenase-like protein
MVTLHPGRYTAVIEGPFVVFLIGFRVNRLLAVRKWLPVAKAMGPMLKELYAKPSLGFLAAHTSLYWRGVMVTQYWRSFDHLVAYAQSRDSIHLPAWKAFNQSVGSDGTVGIWHETYQVAEGNYESVYVNMPRFGLSAAGTHEPATGHRRDARSRMRSGSS